MAQKKTLVKPDGTTTCCKACTSIDMEGQEYCKGCYRAVDGYIGKAVEAPVFTFDLSEAPALTFDLRAKRTKNPGKGR